MENLHKIRKTARSYSIQQPSFQRYQWCKPYNQLSGLPLKEDPTLHQLLLVAVASDHNLPHNADKTSVGLQRKANSIFDCLTIIHPPDISHYPQLAPFLNKWSLITKDTCVLAIICSGYLLEFMELPPIGQLKLTTYAPALAEEISILQKQAIQHILP